MSRESSRDALRFWLLHAGIPALLGLGAFVVFETTTIDKDLADAFFDPALGDFPWHHHWFAEDVVHTFGKNLAIAFGVLVLIALIASRWRRELVAWRRPMTYLVLSLSIGPLVTSAWKDLSHKRCPWDLKIYGGFADFEVIVDSDPPNHRRGCFPCGQASSGFALMSLYFALRGRRRKWAWRGLAIGLVYGSVLGLGRMAQGAHYLSHVVATALVCWYVALVLYALVLRKQDLARAALEANAARPSMT